jgi:hypothetical protein
MIYGLVVTYEKVKVARRIKFKLLIFECTTLQFGYCRHVMHLESKRNEIKIQD